MRRIVNSAEAPGTAGYKCVGRAARHLLRASGTSCEVFSMNDAAAELRQISDELDPPSTDTCLCCGARMTCISVV
eukprot:4835591-Pyramimonas_sp.AAC.1